MVKRYTSDVEKVQTQSPCYKCRMYEICSSTCAEMSSRIPKEIEVRETHKFTKLQKQITYLRIKKELSWSEISKELKITEGALRSIYKRLQNQGAIRVHERSSK